MASRGINSSSAVRLHDSYIYVAYSSDDQGSNFTLIPSILTQYIGFLTLSDPVVTLTANMFSGKWILLNGTAATITVDDTTIGINGQGELYILEEGISENELSPSVQSQLVVQSSTTNIGHVELATLAEVQTGTDTTRVITPAGLVTRTSTTNRTGLIQLATTLEVQTGTDTIKAVTPATMKASVSTESTPGVIEIATSSEVLAGTDNTRAITPAGLVTRTATESRSGIVELASTTEINTFSSNNVVTAANLIAITGGLISTIVNIGNWNMDSTQKVTVAHSLPTNYYKRIRAIDVMIRDDSDSYYSPLIGASLAGETEILHGCIEIVDDTHITLSRYQGGYYDSNLYDTASFNRGWVTIWYYVS